MASSPPHSLEHGGRLLARNAVLNLVGQGAPLLVALLAIPLLVGALGTDRFGMLTIAWVVLGYFSLFDLGMSRALTQLVAERMGGDREREVPALVWTALFLSLGVGLLGGAGCAVLARWAVLDVLKIGEEAVRADSLLAFYALAAAVPVVVSTASLRGILEARQRFGVVNAIRIPLGVFTFAGPLFVLPFSTSLFWIVLVLVVGRAAAWAAHAYFGLRAVPGGAGPPVFERQLVGPLLRFGGWITVSNVVSPLMVYMDRFVIGAVLSATAVAYYATPWEVVTKLLIIPTALSAVLFPAFGYWHRRDRARTAQLYYRGIRLVTLALFPLALAAVVFAKPGLTLWLGETFAEEGYRPMQLLTIGVVLNGAAALPFALVQGLGRPRLTAMLHLAELPVYAGLLWALLHAWGITGAALAWLIRVGIDLAFLLFLSARMLPAEQTGRRHAGTALVSAVGLLGLAMLPGTPTRQLAFFVLSLAAYAVLAWSMLLRPDEKHLVQTNLNRAVRWAWVR